MIVSMKGIYKNYFRGKTEVPVLRDINLQVAQCEYLAIMGPSGSGKTTLMNLLGCLDKPTSGTYLLEDQDIAEKKDDELAELRNKYIGFVFQNFYLLPKMSALENVALPLLYAGVPKKERLERAEQALLTVGLEGRLRFLPNQLSGGQCQRVAIARAMAGNPKLLLADEPTGALDTASGEQVMELFSKINESGATIIMITHEPSIAQCAKKIYHIRDGRLDTGKDGVQNAAE